MIKEMKNLKVIQRDYSLIDGFAWIVFEDKNKEYSLQTCLKELEKCKNEQIRYSLIEQNKPIFKKEVDANNSGMDWGCSGDANENAFTKYGETNCKSFLFVNLRLLRIRIVK